VRRSLLTLIVSLLVAVASGAWAGEDLTAMTNADRAANGLRALVTMGDLQSFAQRRAEDMARAGKLWHAEDLGTRFSNWKRLGENVGKGPSLSSIERNFMASQTHRDNILFARFSEVGVGVASAGKQNLYVSVVFREPGAAAAPAPKPAPALPPAPRPRPMAARPRLAAAAPKPKPAPTTTTTPPTTVPPAPDVAPEPPPPEPVPAPPPAPPVEVVPEAVFQARPVFQHPDFLAANFFGGSLPEPGLEPAFPLRPTATGAVMGLAGVFGGVHATARRWLSRRRGLTGSS
jgi:hypothetical protein